MASVITWARAWTITYMPAKDALMRSGYEEHHLEAINDITVTKHAQRLAYLTYSLRVPFAVNSVPPSS